MAWTCPFCGTYYEYGSLLSTCQTCEHRKTLEEEQRKQTRLLERQEEETRRAADQRERQHNYEATGSRLTDSELWWAEFRESPIGKAFGCLLIYAICYYLFRWGFSSLGFGETAARWCGKIAALPCATLVLRQNLQEASAGGRVVAYSLFAAALFYFTFIFSWSSDSATQGPSPSMDTKQAQSTATTPSTRRAQVGLREFNSLQIYMTLNDAERVLGDDKQLFGTQNTGTSDPVLFYRWSYPDGSSVECSFQSNRLLTRKQSGLK